MTEGKILETAAHLITELEKIASKLGKEMKQGDVVPKDTKETVEKAFQDLLKTIDSYEAANKHKTGPVDKRKAEELKRKCRELLAPWLLRSKYFNRSLCKPHGFPGDYLIIEWIYDLKTNPCEDRTQPGIVNCLDYVFSKLSSVQGASERREYFAKRLEEEYKRCSESKKNFRVLDVACGGARYIKDFLEKVKDASSVSITLVEQDLAAVEYCRTESLVDWINQVTIYCKRAVPLPDEVKTSAGVDLKFDLVISAGLFDYLEPTAAQTLLTDMVGVTDAKGLTAVANFSPDDPSRAATEWLVDWPLIYREKDELVKLFPDPKQVKTEVNSNKTIVYASVRKP
jgi:extracellular factor (EF) 3-hydroxypalmitic acid methyl ester biosynthesis protein